MPYPNPVRDEPHVAFSVQAPGTARVTWDVFTVSLRKVASGTQGITNGGTLVWKLGDDAGTPVSDGLYYLRVRVTSGNESTSQIWKVLVLR